MIHRRLAVLVSAAAVLAAVVTAALIAAPETTSRLVGFRWYDMQTASMSTTAPVGSLAITEPVDFDVIAVDDVITYTRPGSPVPYTHRVVARGPDWLETQGDANTVLDPGRRTEADVAGRMVANIPAAGYALRALPLLLAGLVLAALLGRLLPSRMRPATLMLGGAIAACVASVQHRPFFNLASLNTTPTEDGATIRLANTGIFPLRAQVDDGPHLDLLPGAFGTMRLSARDVAGGAVDIAPHIHMSVGWWALFVALCCAPMLYAIATSLRGEPVRQGPGPVRVVPHDLRRWAATVTATCLVTVLAVVAVALVNPANGAYVSRIDNTENTTSSRTYFSCATMLASTTGARHLAWGMRSGNVWSTSNNYETDLSGNGRSGRWANAGAGATPTRTPSTFPCARDGYSTVNTTAGLWHLSAGTQGADNTTNPNVLSLGIWFKTSSVNQRLLGFGTGTAGAETQDDRNLYIGGDGRLRFGVQPAGVFQVIASPAAVNDNQWHHAAATLGTNGMVLYLDGVQVAQNPAVTTGANYTGQWRVGYGNMSGWPGITSGPVPFIGSVGFTSVSYLTANAAEIRDRYLAALP